jgi:hypothetical protein
MIRKIALIAAIAAQSMLIQAGESATSPYTAHATPGNTAVWVINESTGEITLCEAQGNDKAVCNPSSPPGPKGSYGIAPSDNLTTTWRINRTTGGVSLCEYENTEKPPVCSQWSK